MASNANHGFEALDLNGQKGVELRELSRKFYGIVGRETTSRDEHLEHFETLQHVDSVLATNLP